MEYLIQDKGVQKNAILSSEKQTEFLNPSYVQLIEHRVHKNEESGYSRYHSFSDREMIYLYIHQKKNMNEASNVTERSKKEYLRELLQFANHIVQNQQEIGLSFPEIKKSSLFKSLAPRHIEQYQSWLRQLQKEDGSPLYSPYTLQRKTVIVKSFLTFLERSGYIEVPLSYYMKASTVRKDDRPNKDLSTYESLALLQHFKETEPHPVMFTLLQVLVSTGIRNEELCTLKWKDIHYDGDRADYYASILGKGNKRRFVPLKTKVYQSIQEYATWREVKGVYDKGDKEQHIFVTGSGRPYSPSYLSQYIKKQVGKLQLPMVIERNNAITPHTFRHAFAIISHHQGVSVYDIQRSLGHEHISTTEIYLQKEFEKERHAVHQWHGELMEYI